MTPQLTAAIAAIQPLSPLERQQLLQILTQIDTSSSQTKDFHRLLYLRYFGY